MSLYYSGNNIVCGNTMLSNYPGIDLDSSSANNTIYHNNFNNTDQARSESENVWSYGDEGNYWSDYTGQDLNKDGIGDTSYDINVANKDNYPLMGMFYEYSITLKGETYNVTVISNSTISIFRFQIGAETGNKILRFNATGKDGTSGFCRAKIPIGLMNYPYIVLVDSEEIFPTVLNVSNEAYAYLYFTYLNENNTIGIISSKTLALYFELLDEYVKLHKDLYDLNETYYTLLENYNILLLNFSALIENYNSLLYNYTQLQVTFHDLNDSYLKHLLDYSEQMQNIRNLTYILVALTAILIITTIYLSKRAHANVNTKIKAIEGK
jgi:parallel beta-helix repeat protein